MNSKLIFSGILLLAASASVSAAGVRGGRQLASDLQHDGGNCFTDEQCASGACAQGEKGKYICCAGKNKWSIMDIRGGYTQWCIEQPLGAACDRLWDTPLIVGSLTLKGSTQCAFYNLPADVNIGGSILQQQIPDGPIGR